MYKKAYGFTIVELLIVIVVIAILAAISVVAYTGIQDRAKYSKALSSLQQMKKAVELYYADQGQYPHSGAVGTSTWRFSCAYPSDSIGFIPGISIAATSFPLAPCTDASTSNDSWIYLSNGTGYKLLYIRASVSNTFRDLIPTGMRDPTRWSATTNITWGFWSPGGQAL